MLQLKKILLAHDFSECSQHAVPYALDLAGRTGAELHVVHVSVLPLESFETPQMIAMRTAELNTCLGRLVSDQDVSPSAVSKHVQVEVSFDLTAAPALLRYADRHGIGLVVMGSHGHRGVRRLMLGSVAEEVARRASCPVLIVHRNDGTGPRAVRRILVPVDFSQHSARSVREAAAVAAVYGASAALLFVAEERHVVLFNDTGIPVFANEAPPQEIVEGAARALQRVADWAGLRSERTTHHVVTGRPAREIVAFAREHAVDMIAMSTHGSSGLRYFLVGGVAEAVVRSATCPVLITRAFGQSLVDDVVAVCAAPDHPCGDSAAGTIPDVAPSMHSRKAGGS